MVLRAKEVSTRGIETERARGRWIPWVFIGGFVLVLAVNGTMIALALSSFTGLTTAEPYTKGLRFNEDIRHAEEQERLGWRVASGFEKRGERKGEIELKIVDRMDHPISGAKISAAFSRPVERGHDFAVALEPAGDGRYFGRIDFPLPGVWDVRYRVAHDGRVLEARDRFEVQ